MTVDCPGFTPSSNPRIHGCQRCGKVRFAHPAQPSRAPVQTVRGITAAVASVGQMRDREYEERFLKWVTTDARTRELVLERMDWGDREYGTQFNDRGDDGIREATEEAIDGISWLLLHAQNRALSDEARAAVVRACQAFARAHRELAACRVTA
jgi:hypothetical protein